MLHVLLYDKAPSRNHLLPLVSTRPVGDLRVGIMTLQQKWALLFGCGVSHITSEALMPYFGASSDRLLSLAAVRRFLVIQANSCPDAALYHALSKLMPGQCLAQGQQWIALCMDSYPDEEQIAEALAKAQVLRYEEPYSVIQYPEDLLRLNRAQLQYDYSLLTSGRSSAPLSSSNSILGDALFVEEGVQAECCTFNSLHGPIYIGEGAVIEQGSHLQGPLSIGRGSRVKMGTTIYPNVTVGPESTVGGELNNVVIWGDSAKGHHGYLGAAVVGAGCNIGAGTSNSNLQNNWGKVSLYDYALDAQRDTGLHKCGVIIGDYAMIGINSSLTTGAVIGVGAQVANSNFIPKFVPDFIWFTATKTESYNWDKFAEMMSARATVKGHKAAVAEQLPLLSALYQQTEVLRTRIINTK